MEENCVGIGTCDSSSCLPIPECISPAPVPFSMLKSRDLNMNELSAMTWRIKTQGNKVGGVEERPPTFLEFFEVVQSFNSAFLTEIDHV